MAVGLFQMRVYVDPLLGYYGQIQWMTAAVLASLILLERYLETRRAGWLVGAVLAYLLAALTYEVSYTLVVLHLWRVMRLRPRWVDRIRIALPFGLVIFACAGMSVLMRKWYPNNLYLQGPRLDPAAVGKAFAEQSTAALPLAYFVGDPLGIFATVRSPAEFVRWILDPGVAVVAILALAVAYFALRRGRFEPVRSGYGMLAAAGLALATLPGVLIAISPYHQNYLTWGVGWISVLTQLFGVALVFATIGWAWVASAWLGGRFARGKCLAVATLVALGLGLNERANREVAACFSAPVGSPRNRAFAASHGASWHLPRLNIEAALDAGLLEDVPARANLQVTHQYPYWHDPMYGPMFYAKHTGKPLTVAAESSAPGYRIRDLCVDATTGYVVLSEQGAPGARPVRLFVRHPGLTREMFQVFDVEHNNRLEHLTEIRTGPGWGLYRLEARNPETIEVVGAEGKWRAFDEPRAVAEQDRRAIIR
jgi:MFS family permease